MINVNENGFVSARVLYSALELSRPFSQWFKSALLYGFDTQDYTPYASVHPQNKQEIQDFWLTLDMAKEVAMISKAPKSKEVRKYLIELSNKKEEGLLLTHSDIVDLFAMVKAAFVDNFRELAKKKHIESYLPNNPQGYHYGKAQLQRNKVCGIDKKDLERRLNEVNIKYEKVQSALIQIDKYELIRIAIIDVMIHFGKTNEYAINVGNLAKELAKKESQSFTSSDNTLFPLPKEYNQIYLQLNK